MAPFKWLRHGTGLTALAMFCALPAAHAFRLDLSTGIGGEYSSNVMRTERNREHESIGYVWAGVSAHEEAANLTAEVAGMVETRQYFNDVASDEVRLSLAALVDWMILPQRLNWHFENYFQQRTRDPFETYSPSNQQDTNVLWTGPDLYFRFAQLYTLQFGARYGNFYYEETEGDNQRFAGFVRASRQLTPSTEIYAQGQRTIVEYDHAGRSDEFTGVTIRDFDRDDGFVGIHWESIMTEVEIEGGYTRISRDGAEDIDGAFGRLQLLRYLPNDGGTGVRLSSELTEGGDRLLSSRGGRLDVDPRGRSGFLREDIARELYAELFYYGRWLGVGSDLRVYWVDEDYEEALLDERRAGVALHLGYPVAPAWMLSAFGLHENRKFERSGLFGGRDRRDRRSMAGVALSHRLSRQIAIDFEVRDEWQNSNIPGHDFNEWVALIELRYGERPHWVAR